MNPPRLLAAKRRGLALALAGVALGQAGMAAAFAAAISAMIVSLNAGLAANALPATFLAAAIGGAMLAERWIAERFAQSFMLDCRASLFGSVIINRGDGNDSRWLTALVGDLAAIRNYAVRGSIKLWTSLMAGIAASLWFLRENPAQWSVLLPFLAGLMLLAVLQIPLRRVIAEQRRLRGRLNRFLIRRVRIEMAAAPCPRGHGRRRLEAFGLDMKAGNEQRALTIGAMELVAAIAGGIAAIQLIALQAGSPLSAAVVGQITLIGFIATRMLETARALNARAGGKIALARLAGLLAREPRSGRGTPLASTDDLD